MMKIVPPGLRLWANEVDRILALETYPPKVTPNSKQKPLWNQFSNWALICENILDTKLDSGWILLGYEVLIRRGFDDATIMDMRYFAWLTAGWLNYEKCLWEWVHIDQNHIEWAIDLQLKENLITQQEHALMIGYLQVKS